MGKKKEKAYCLHEFCGVVIVLVYNCWLRIYFFPVHLMCGQHNKWMEGMNLMK